MGNITDAVSNNKKAPEHSAITKKLLGMMKRTSTSPTNNSERAKKPSVSPKTGLDFVDVELVDFLRKGCLIDEEFYERDRLVIRNILTRNGASIKRTFSNRVDYVISFKRKRTKNNSLPENIEMAITESQKSGKPYIVDGYELIRKSRNLVMEEFLSRQKDDKFEYALSLYRACIEKVETAMNKTKTYNNPTCSDCYIKSSSIPSTDFVNVKEFLFEAAKLNLTWQWDTNKKANSYFEAYSKIMNCGGESFYECVGIEFPIAIAVAVFVYGNPDVSMDLEWVRDKWELRGDYRSSFCIAFELSSNFPEGRVYNVRYTPYDM